MSELNEFLRHPSVSVVSIGDITADRYSRIACQLRSEGTPIPTNDIWIAAETNIDPVKRQKDQRRGEERPGARA